jgi:uncharacterized protein YutE (UPF0331/DUF86 family)
MIDRQLIRSRIREIEESLSRLEEFREISRERFLKERDLQDIASFRLLIIIEASISICQHICAREIHKAPGTYSECFAMLEATEIISPGLSKKMQQMARFRNMLVHVYWDIDYSLVLDIIKERLPDVRDYLNQIIKKYLL